MEFCSFCSQPSYNFFVVRYSHPKPVLHFYSLSALLNIPSLSFINPFNRWFWWFVREYILQVVEKERGKKIWQFILFSVEILGLGLIFLPSQITIIYIFVLFFANFVLSFCGSFYANQFNVRPKLRRGGRKSIFGAREGKKHALMWKFIFVFSSISNE